MRWPFHKQRTEHRASATDALVAAIQAAAGGWALADSNALASLETAVSLYSSAFAAARVRSEGPVADLLTPEYLAMAVRAMLRRGEFLTVLDVTPVEGLTFAPCGSWDVRGGVAERDWWYRCDLQGPSGSTSRTVPADAVLHMKWAVDPARPWRGVAPLEAARATGQLAANLEQRLGEEAGQPTGAYLALPKRDGTDPDAADDPDAKLRADIRAANGRQVFVESMATAWGEGPRAAPRSDWSPKRFGADPPEVLEALRSSVGQAVLSACGVPVALATDADGTSARAAWARFVQSSCAGTARIVASELRRKLGVEVEIDFSRLFAHDVTGRARACGALVKAAGMPLADAREVCGI